MLKLNCPFCGERDVAEFRCGGQSHIARPGPHDQVSDDAWGRYLYFRDNPAGWHFERWLHAAGCRVLEVSGSMVISRAVLRWHLAPHHRGRRAAPEGCGQHRAYKPGDEAKYIEQIRAMLREKS